MQKLIITIRTFLGFTVILGVVYPLLIMAIGQAVFPDKAKGSLLIQNGKIIGSSLIAQEFTINKYFHSRFSAVNYNAANSGSSNLALSNAKLYKQVEQHIAQVKLKNGLLADTKLPADMVHSSASGLDPHISLANAMLQLPRVMQARNLPKEIIKKLIDDNIDNDFIGIWGQKGVNVLKLNLALDKLERFNTNKQT